MPKLVIVESPAKAKTDVYKRQSFFTPRLWAACGKSSSGCRSVHDGTLLKSLLESGFAWSSYLLISGCFLSVTILYHSPKVSSIRRPHNLYMQYLCIIRIE